MNTKGLIIATVLNAMTGKTEGRHLTTNVVMRLARAEVLKRITSSAINASGVQVIRYIVVGSGNTAPTTAQTNLEDIIGSAQIDTLDDSGITSAPPDRIFKYQFQTNEANGNTREVGLKNSDGSLFARAHFACGGVSAVSLAANAVVTVAGTTNLASGDSVFIDNMPGGNSSLNNRIFSVRSVINSAFTLVGEDTSGQSAFASGGRYVKNIAKNSSQILEIAYTLVVTN